MAEERKKPEGDGASLIDYVPAVREITAANAALGQLPVSFSRRGLLAAIGGFAAAAVVAGAARLAGQAEGAPPDEGGAANTRDAIAPVQTPGVGAVKAEVPDLNAAAPVRSDTAVVRSETVTEMPDEWRWYLKEVKGEFFVIINRTMDGKSRFLVKVIKSDCVDDETAPDKKIENEFPKTEREAANIIIENLAQWCERSPDRQREILTRGPLVKTKRIVFERVTK